MIFSNYLSRDYWLNMHYDRDYSFSLQTVLNKFFFLHIRIGGKDELNILNMTNDRTKFFPVKLNIKE